MIVIQSLSSLYKTAQLTMLQRKISQNVLRSLF